MALTDRGRVLRARAQEAPVAWLTRHVFDHDAVCRMALMRPSVVRLFRGHLGIARTRADVDAVLADDATFAAGYTTRLPGPFVLGVEGADHAAMRAELAAALAPRDVDAIAARTRQLAGDAVAEASTTLDVGIDLVHPVLDTTVSEYLGVAGSDPATRWMWGRDIFEHIFLNFADAPALRANCAAATAQLSELISDAIAARRDGPNPDDVLGRLITSGALDTEAICINLIGLAVGWWWHGARTAIIAVDQILRSPERTESARVAAEQGEPELQVFLWEVLRHRPVQLGVIRTCTSDAVVAGQQVRRGGAVVAGTQAAMGEGGPMDLLFGGGIHRCMGEQIMTAQLPALLRPLLVQKGLRRRGKLRWDGPRPDGFVVRW